MGLDETLNIVIKTIGAEKAKSELIAFSKLVFETQHQATMGDGGTTAFLGKAGFDKRMAMRNRESKIELSGVKKRLQAEGKAKDDFEKWWVDQKIDWDNKAHKAVVKQQKDANKAVLNERKRFKAEYLSIMFAGMALQRTFGGLFKGMIDNYKEFTKESVTPLSESLTRLEANWKFLKFAMVDAASDVISSIADWFSGVARAMSKMDPSTLKSLTTVIGSLAILGGFATVFGQTALLFTSMSSAAAQKEGLIAINNTLKGVNGMPGANTLNAGSKFFDSIATAAGIGAIAFAIKDVFEGIDQLGNGDWLGAIYNSMAAGAKVWGGVELMKGNLKAGGAFVLLGVAFDLIEQDKFGKTLFAIPSLIAGVLGGIVNVMAQATLRIYDQVKGTILEYIFFPNKTSRDLLSSMKQVDFGTAFTEGFGPLYLQGMSLGEDIDSFTSDLRKKSKLAKENAEEISGVYADVWTAFQNRNSEATIKIKDNTYDYLTDEKSGLKALLLEVNKINEGLNKPIKKNVYINEIRSGSPQSVNYWTGD